MCLGGLLEGASGMNGYFCSQLDIIITRFI